MRALAIAIACGLAAPVASAREVTAPAGPLVRADAPEVRGCSPAAPPGWQLPGFDDALLGGGPEAPGCGALRVRRRFEVRDPARLATLTLSLRYQDGLVAWINGVEVARRRFVDGAEAASEPHGGEVERLVVPVGPGLLQPGANLLALEVRAARTARAARAPGLEVGLEGAEGVRVVRGPYLTRVLDREAELAFETDLPTRAEVRFGETGSPAGGPDDCLASDGQLGTSHRVRLAGLRPGTAYRYLVVASAPGLAPVEEADAFHTMPGAGHPLRFVVTGDTRSGHDVHAQLVKAIAAEDPDLVLGTGDLVGTGSDEAEWQRFFAIEAPLLRRVPLMSAIGNHEYWRSASGARRFLELFGRDPSTPWWSFDAAGVHFVLLDSESYRDPVQLAWLKRDLAEAQRRRPRAIFACTHHGPWSTGLHGDNPDAIRDYVPVLEAARVTMLFSGHDHHYERGQVGRLRYIVTGGGGAELRQARCGVPGKRACPPHVAAFFNEHHYLDVEVQARSVRLCPRRVDGTPLEPCTTIASLPPAR